VVDDNHDSADSLALLLRATGHEVTVVNDPHTALDVAARERPATMLLDIGLPDIDGYELCRRMRQGGASNAFIVALTGYGQERDRQRSREAGFDAHMVKPVEFERLQELLATAPRRAPDDGR
jgi:DNA-binding response OmpR family regulator